MTEANKTYSLLFCDQQKFLSVKGKIVKVTTTNHEKAFDLFIDNYQEQIINKTIMTFCYEDEAIKYGYEYVISNQSE